MPEDVSACGANSATGKIKEVAGARGFKQDWVYAILQKGRWANHNNNKSPVAERLVTVEAAFYQSSSFFQIGFGNPSR